MVDCQTTSPAPQAPVSTQPPQGLIDGQRWLQLTPAERDQIAPPGSKLRAAMDGNAAAFQSGVMQQAIANGVVQPASQPMTSPAAGMAPGIAPVPAPAPTGTLAQQQASVCASESGSFFDELCTWRCEARDIATAVKVVIGLVLVGTVVLLIYYAVK